MVNKDVYRVEKVQK